MKSVTLIHSKIFDEGHELNWKNINNIHTDQYQMLANLITFAIKAHRLIINK